VLVSSTPAAAGVVSAFENMYFGWPNRTAGNLLTFNTEPGEIDTTGWTVGANCSLSLSAPPWQWSVDNYWTGGPMITMAVTANGDASMVTADRAPVTVGTEYLGFCYLQPPTAASSTWVELRFYNAAGAQIQATRSVLAAPSTSVYRQIASAVAPTGAATASLAVGITGGTAGQMVRADCSVVKTRTTLVTGTTPDPSVVPYADTSFEQGIGQWTVASGVATIARSTPWGAQTLSSSYSLTITSSTATASTLRSGRYPVSALLSWRPQASFKRTAGGWTLATYIRWYDAGGTLISTGTSAPDALPSTGWWVLPFDYTAPAGAATGQIEFALTATAAASVLQMDSARLTQVLPLAEVTTSDATASISLIFRELIVGQLITLYRIGADGSRSVVRGRDGLLDQVLVTDDQMILEDYEAPLGIPVTYRLEKTIVSTGATGGWLTTLPVTIDPGDRNYSWLKDPARPQLNVRALVRQAPDWSQPIEQNIMRIRGRQNALILSGVRGGREGALALWTQTDSERDALRMLLSTGQVLLWQSAPGMGEPDVYVSVADTTAPRVTTYAPEPWREWTLPLTEVDRPITGLAGSATWTVQDVLIENATVLSLLSRYTTVLDLALDQRTA
jgi:hypothetical protein